MKFPNFLMNTSFSARAFVLLVGLLLLATAGFAQKTPEAATTLDIEQCANGPLAAPIHCDTSGANQGYGRGNLVSSKSHYFEGDFVPIRITSTNLTAGSSYSLTIGYDYTKGGKYATDYIGDYNYTESTSNNPCVDIAGCSLASGIPYPVPPDPQVAKGFDGISGTSDDIIQIAGSITCFGCTITNVTTPTVATTTTSDSSKFMTITFTANQTNIVIAYGSHISTRRDWGIANSAINITGSPYHNFISDPGTVPANNGNRDLQLSAEAVIFPAKVSVVKLVDNSDGTYSNILQSFGFTSNIPNLSTFSLTDTDPAQFGGGSTPIEDVVLFGSANTLTVSENADAPGTGYSLSNVVCTVTAGSQGGVVGTWSTTFPAGRSASIVLQEGNIAVCTFTNTRVGVTAAPATVTGRVLSSTGSPLSGITLTLTDLSTGETKTATSTSFGYYTFSDLTVQDFYQLTVTSKRYRFSTPSRTFTLNSDLADMDFICTNQ